MFGNTSISEAFLCLEIYILVSVKGNRHEEKKENSPKAFYAFCVRNSILRRMFKYDCQSCGADNGY